MFAKQVPKGHSDLVVLRDIQVPKARLEEQEKEVVQVLKDLKATESKLDEAAKKFHDRFKAGLK